MVNSAPFSALPLGVGLGEGELAKGKAGLVGGLGVVVVHLNTVRHGMILLRLFVDGRLIGDGDLQIRVGVIALVLHILAQIDDELLGPIAVELLGVLLISSQTCERQLVGVGAGVTLRQFVVTDLHDEVLAQINGLAESGRIGEGELVVGEPGGNGGQLAGQRVLDRLTGGHGAVLVVEDLGNRGDMVLEFDGVALHAIGISSRTVGIGDLTILHDA